MVEFFQLMSKITWYNCQTLYGVELNKFSSLNNFECLIQISSEQIEWYLCELLAPSRGFTDGHGHVWTRPGCGTDGGRLTGEWARAYSLQTLDPLYFHLAPLPLFLGAPRITRCSAVTFDLNRHRRRNPFRTPRRIGSKQIRPWAQEVDRIFEFK